MMTREFSQVSIPGTVRVPDRSVYTRKDPEEGGQNYEWGQEIGAKSGRPRGGGGENRGMA